MIQDICQQNQRHILRSLRKTTTYKRLKLQLKKKYTSKITICTTTQDYHTYNLQTEQI